MSEEQIEDHPVGASVGLPDAAIPAGWRLVPEYPTDEMWHAWRKFHCQHGVGGMEEFTYFQGDFGNWVWNYQEMLAAAPSASDSPEQRATGSTEIRNQALEDAAVICEEEAKHFTRETMDCAAAIRAAKEQA